MENKLHSMSEEMEGYVCKDDLYYEEIIIEYLSHGNNIKGGDSEYEVQI